MIDVVSARAGELRTSAVAWLLMGAYRASHGERHWRVASAICSVLLRLEGGGFRSATVRHILKKYHGVEVGAYTYGDCLIPGRFPQGVIVGRYTSIAPGVRVFNQNHPIDFLSVHPYFYDPRLGVVDENPMPRRRLLIGSDVWIGHNAIVTPGCTRIGHGAIVGAGAIVTKDVDDFAIVAGNPAKLLRYRFSQETRRLVLASRWWERPIEECVRVLEDMQRRADDCAFSHPLLVPVADREA